MSSPQHHPNHGQPSLSPPPRSGSQNPSNADGTADPNADEKPRLSEHEKKANHIASEQKRRQAIREGFDRLTELVPGLEGQGRSESVVLKKTVDYMRLQLEERRRLVRRIEELGGGVEEGMRR
jgi:heteromeric Ino2p/Ino4p transcription factor